MVGSMARNYIETFHNVALAGRLLFGRCRIVLRQSRQLLMRA
ncbi:hypothetical protein RISK_000352 [Rhodopirellula islandica]|uniref:Uncharacterized protein n=1 Tax=Rhodopirellula islandica TaxID=595434 RepID=A0A0J1EP59_RHOIS|nr:hypothetical protein RISK_000352 [Rhodopirellula islandica]